MSELNNWIHDDITWCTDKCDNIDCYRNIANRGTKVGMYSAAMLKGTEYCPLDYKYKWTKVHGYCTAGGDPIYACGKCHKGMHVHGVEHPEKMRVCPDCGAKNEY